MTDSTEPIRLSLMVSPGAEPTPGTTCRRRPHDQERPLRRAIALYDVVYATKLNKNRLGFFDQDHKLVTEIMGI